MTQPSFRVDPTQLQPIMGSIGELRDNLVTLTERGLQPHIEGRAAVFGEYGAAHAWTELLQMWTKELRCAARSAERFGLAMEQALANYRASDADSAQLLVTR